MASGNACKNEKTVKENSEKEDDINALLDSALDDFDIVKNNELKNNKENVEKSDEIRTDVLGDMSLDPRMNQIYDQLFEEFNILQPNSSQSQFSQATSSQAPQATSSSSQKPLSDPSSNAFNLPADITKLLQEGLNGLNDMNTHQASTEGPSEEELVKLMAELGRTEGEGDASSDQTMQNMMQKMMKNLLSKELCYTPLKEISTMYPGWLAENEKTLSDVDKKRYKQQNTMMHSMVQLYEEESPNDSQEMKDKRFARLLDLMQNMQQLGAPPKELAGDFSGFSTDEMGFPKNLDEVMSNPSQCAMS